MSKVFRKERGSSINKASKFSFLWYTLGEIFLIVVGIILAVQINEWIQGKKQQREQQFLLEKVHVEFEKNLLFANIVDSINTLYVAECDMIIDLFPIDTKSPDLLALSSSLNRISTRIPYRPTAKSIDVLFDSQSFKHLSDEDLEVALLNWNSNIDSYYAQESNVIKQLDQDFASFMSKHFAWRPVDLNDPRTDLKVLETFAFENKVKDRRAKLNALVGSIKARIEEIELILELTD